MFRIEMLPAGHGDCLLIEYGNSAVPHRVLIDTGPFYACQSLAKRINDLASSGQTLELFIITHVDTDHIDGAIKLLNAEPEGLKLRDVWFNGRDHLLPGRRTKKRGPIHGELLSELILERKLPWNDAFGGQAVTVKKGEPLPSNNLHHTGLTLTLLSPEWQELIHLEPAWKKEIDKAGLLNSSRDKVLEELRNSPRYRPRRAGPPDVNTLAARQFEEEKSKTNASSIAFLAEYEGKTCLFAADAQPYRLVDSIKVLLKQRGKPKLKVDVVKLSHHGSRGNTSPDLLSLLDCKHFLISTNGDGGFKPPHPHAEAIARVVKGCGPDVELWFNYHSNLTDPWDNAGLKQKYRYKTHYPEKGQEGLVIPVSEL